MEELERYECFAVPPHEWTAAPQLAEVSAPVRTLLRPPLPGFDFLGMDALPSPSFTEFRFDA